MQMIIGCTDGKTYKSDIQDVEVILAETGMTQFEFDHQMLEMVKIFKNLDSASHISMLMGGRDRYFNPSNVVWVDVIIS